MTTGKILKLVAFVQRIATYVHNGILLTDVNDNEMAESRSYRERRLVVDTGYCRIGCNTIKYDGEYIYVDGQSITSMLKTLSGDIEASATLRAEYAASDELKEHPNYERQKHSY